jgi:protein-tyrosine phosphatase
MTDEAPVPPVQPDDAHRAAMRAATKRIDRVNEWLLVGGAVPPSDYQRFCDAGITHVVDLREDPEVDADLARLEALGIARRQVAVPNHGAPTAAQLEALANWIDGEPEDANVYVHCGGGFGRAATMAVALLIVSGSDVDEAISEVRQARPEIRINDTQIAWLRAVEQTTRQKS